MSRSEIIQTWRTAGSSKVEEIAEQHPNNMTRKDVKDLDRYVQSRKIFHAALLLLMLEAAQADLVSPSA
jgi:hypothetical protein